MPSPGTTPTRPAQAEVYFGLDGLLGGYGCQANHPSTGADEDDDRPASTSMKIAAADAVVAGGFEHHLEAKGRYVSGEARPDPDIVNTRSKIFGEVCSSRATMLIVTGLNMGMMCR
jgi:hypothetical protein